MYCTHFYFDINVFIKCYFMRYSSRGNVKYERVFHTYIYVCPSVSVTQYEKHRDIVRKFHHSVGKEVK